MPDLNLVEAANAPEGFPFLENHVRARMGIGRDEIRALRQTHLTEGTDWCLKKKRVWLAHSGVAALTRVKLAPTSLDRPGAQTVNPDDGGALKAEVPKNGADQKTAAKKAPEVVAFQVVRATKNPHIILCCPMSDSALQPKKTVRVRVRTSVNFRRFMEVPATLVAGYEDLYDLARACPKKPGKW